MNRLFNAALLVLVVTPLMGCGQSKEATVIHDESEMVKYRSTPEQIEAGMQAAATAAKPSAADIRAIEAQAKAAAALAPQ